jgi:hypothetical protein
MPTISPFGLDGNTKIQDYSPPLSSRAKGCAPPEYMLKSLSCCADHTPPDDLQKDIL